MKPAKHQYTILKQICQHIPAHLVPKLARSFGIDKKARSFSPWSHVVAMLHVQIAHRARSAGCLRCYVAYYSAAWMPLALCRSVVQHVVHPA